MKVSVISIVTAALKLSITDAFEINLVQMRNTSVCTFARNLKFADVAVALLMMHAPFGDRLHSIYTQHSTNLMAADVYLFT